jgi:hypothetical protein
MEIVNEGRKLEHGDIVTINGREYYCEHVTDPYSWSCGLCAFKNRHPCYKWLNKEGLDCTENSIYFITVNNVIKREKKKIRESQKLINKLSK